ncbi:PAS domain S-box protein [Natronolimnohabitans sp. A-GB9]|uniref:PAS domain S-box protein n=1 Tax=Natronolimnohabitans sp. A-GB9 TaxID=3069757 RepID=UPI0027AF522B|nr:PAS domain S-box protein [Natronolimnohabitans sp. A-GB9]MDQ2052483.1 PAS domain S-box protein [Natronolimnohabitans sp. A-GB9]
MSTRFGAEEDGFWGEANSGVVRRAYRRLANRVSDGVYRLDADGRFVAINDGFVELTGYGRDELLGEHVSVLLEDATVSRIEREIERHLAEGVDELDTLTLSVETADGEWINCELDIDLLVADGEFRGTIGVARECPQRSDSIETTQSSYDSLTSVLEEANIGVIVLDDECTVTRVNETIERYFGLERAEIVSRDKRELIDDTIKYAFADPKQFAETVIATYEDNSYIEQFECRVTAGEDRAERWLEHYSTPLESGPYAGGRIELYYDITDRKRSEGARQETEERFQSLVDAVEEYAIFRLDPDGYVVSWNDGAEAIKGYETEEILGEHCSTFYTESDRAADVPEQHLEAAIEDGSVEDEGWRVRKDGSRFWASVTISAVWNDDGSLRGFLKVTRDMTDRYEREQELENELQRVFGRISDAFYALDEECRFTHVNERAEQILDADQDDLLGTDIWTAFPDLKGTVFEDRYREAMTDQEAVSFEAYAPSNDAWFEVHAYPSETGLSVYFRDVTERVERERELERTERRFEAIFQDPNILVGLLEPDGTVLDINETAMEYIDADLENVTGEPFWETPWWGEGDAVQPEIKRRTERAADGEYVEFETSLTRPNGEEYTLSGFFRPVTDEDGEVVSIIVSDRDVTERKKREQQLRKSEQRYRTLAENFPNGIVTMFDDECRYTLAAGEAFGDLPVAPDDVEGKTVEAVWPDEPARRLGTAFRDALEGERRVVDVEYAGREWVVRIVPLTGSDGTVFGGMTIAQDITERKERKRALEESKRRYQTLVEHFPNGAVGLYDEELTYTVVGGELIDELGIDPDMVVGNAITERYPDELVAEYGSCFEAALQGESNTFEAEYHGRDLVVHTLPVRNADGEIHAGMVMVQDITERKEYERKLEESNERLEQFAYAASHDLQEPLRMVSSYLQLIESRYADVLDEDGEEFLEYAIDGADRMRAMIDGLLEYSRVETRGDPLEPTDLDDVLEDVLEDLRLRIESTDAEITAEDLPRVEGDPSQLRQVFQNLLSNAIEYSGDEPPRIHVGAQRVGDQWRISIRDEGIGIDPDETDRIFEVFQRLHSREDHSGTGIGLALCRRIVERHGGRIWVDSEPSDGSTFSFTLPAVDE